MAAYRNPFGGRRTPGSNKASRQKQFRKKKSNDNGNQPSAARNTRSPWRLLGAVGSFAAVFIFNLIRSQGDSKSKRLSDKRVLQTMLFKPMVYTDHAICRMKCRFISDQDVQESLQSGRINIRKSQTRLRPCAKYVVDAKVGHDKRRIETVFSACPANTKVVTVIDQDTDWECYCP